ncbi:MAG: hypothetical protein WC299_16670 [Kiritimatiellia bacterium]
MNVTYKYRDEHNLCRQCGIPLPQPSKYKRHCEACTVKQATNAKARYARNRAAQRCTGCGGEPRPGKTLCSACKHLVAGRSHEWRERRKATARCIYCNEPKWHQSTMCQRHFVEKRLANYKVPKDAVSMMLARLEAQDNKCFYTGVSLVAGVNLSIDHYHSVKYNPDRISDTSNLVWADEATNNAKRETPVAVFIAMCERVIANKAAILAWETSPEYFRKH